MTYGMLCLLPREVEEYHHRLVSEVAEKFDLEIAKRENLPAHFTLKYSFETDRIQELEQLIKEFVKRKKQPIRIGGFGGFAHKVVFIDIKPTENARKLFIKLFRQLKTRPWMQWDKFDSETLHFHATLAKEVNDKYDEVIEFLKGKEKYFDSFFDNISIIEFEKTDGVITEWDIYRRFALEF